MTATGSGAGSGRPTSTVWPRSATWRPGRSGAVVRPDTTLKAALDGIVTTHTRVAVAVDDNERYLGMLTVDDLAEGITA